MNMMSLRLFIVTMALLLDMTWCFTESSVTGDARYQAGKERYELIQRETTMPKYSMCWTKALDRLESGCKQLTDDTQHRLSLKFTNCFLMKTGRKVYECSDTDGLEVCTRDMTPEAYNTYTEFFTHTQNICFFLQAQQWQAETENTIERLSDNSAVVAQQIEDSSQLQAEVIQKQNESIRNQQILLERGQELKSTLEESTVDVHHMLREFKDSTSEQRALIFEVFDRLNSLQTIVMGEFTGFYSVIFYAVSILMCYLLTSTPRTSSARFWLFVIMTVNIVVERIVASCGTQSYEDANTGQMVDENTQVYRRLWWCRKVFSTVAILTWCRCAYMFQDINRINNQLLVEIRKQNSDLKHLLQQSPHPAVPDDSFLNKAFDAADCVDYKPDHDTTAADTTSLVLFKNTTDINNSTTGYESDAETTDSDDSFNSMMTDHTYTVTHVADDDDNASYCTTASWETSSLMDELRDLRDSTPIRELVGAAGDNMHNITGSPKRGRGRPKGSKNKTMPYSPDRYNLRSRRSVGSPVATNPLLITESANDFGKMVRHLAAVSQRNRVKAEVTINRGKRA